MFPDYWAAIITKLMYAKGQKKILSMFMRDYFPIFFQFLMQNFRVIICSIATEWLLLFKTHFLFMANNILWFLGSVEDVVPEVDREVDAGKVDLDQG